MKTTQKLTLILRWLPSVVITFFYIPNALDKLISPNQTGKVVENSAIMIIAGLFLLLATACYLYHKTILIGTFMLSFYMTFIVLIHLYKGKPFEVALLLVVGTILASYLRKPTLFQSQHVA